MSSQGPKRALFAQFAAVAKTLGHAHRLELLEQLAQGERSVEILAQRTGLSIANASQHLQHMRRAGLVANRRDGKFVYYRLADDAVLDLLAALRRIAERNVPRSSGWCAAISMIATPGAGFARRTSAAIACRRGDDSRRAAGR